MTAAVAVAPDLRAKLDRAREVSYQQHWQQAQGLLDELAPLMAGAEIRDQADFHLLEARHLVLADRSHEGLERALWLLGLDLPTVQRERTLQFAANISVLLRRYEEAFGFLGEALAIEPDPNDPLPRVATLNMAAYMFGRVGEYETGIELGEQAVALARTKGDLNESCVALQRLAPVFKWAGQVERAEAAYRQGIDECRQAGNTLFVGVLEHGLADLLRPDRPEEALILAERSIAALVEAVYPLGEFEARLVRAEAMHGLGRLDAESGPELAELAAYFRQGELWDQQARLEQLKASQAAQAGDFEAALAHLQAENRAREAFFGRERALRLAYLQVEFETRLRDQEIELLRESARVAQLEAETLVQQRRLRGLGLVIVVLAFLLLLSVLLRTWRSRMRFRELSRQDRLSGLFNHSWFFEQAERMLAQVAQSDQSGGLVLVVADIDHFKEVNDVLGHRVGDEVLGRTARRLREVFPGHALVGRIGGEEFAVLVLADDVEQVLHCIEQFRRTGLAAVRAGDPEVTLSFGVSCYRPGDDIHALRERADRAMYTAKRDGRDCWRVDESCRSGTSA